MPKLKQLCLGYFTSWPKRYFTNLTHLCLYNQDQLLRPCTSDFLDILESSPQLESLALIDAGRTRPFSDDVPLVLPGRLVALDCLQELSMNNCSGIFAITRLLSHLSLPKLADMHFWGSSLTSRGEEELSSLFPSDIFYLDNLQDIRECRVIEYDDDNSFVDIVSVVDGVLYVKGNMVIPQFATIPLRFPLSNVKSLLFESNPLNTVNPIYSRQVGMISQMWRDTFDHLLAIENLTIRPISVDEIKLILEDLYPCREVNIAVPCPHLASIRLEKYTVDMSTYLAFFLAVLAEERRGIESVEIVSLNKDPRAKNTWRSHWDQPYNNSIGNDSNLDPGEEDSDDEDEVHDNRPMTRSDGMVALKRRVRDVTQRTRTRAYAKWVPAGWPAQAYL